MMQLQMWRSIHETGSPTPDAFTKGVIVLLDAGGSGVVLKVALLEGTDAVVGTVAGNVGAVGDLRMV